MLEAFESHIDHQFPFLKKEKILIACSGGLDSVVLTWLAHKLGFNFALAHCNFNLRDKESDADEDFVTQLSKALDVAIHLKHFNTKAEKVTRGGSTQMVARDLRYQWFKELLETESYTYLLTAHHADDSLETFIINMSRGTGIEGLRGIPNKNGKIIRPLLSFSRAAILSYATSNDIKWREDSSNTDTKYLRNQIRHQLTPKLKELNTNFLINFLNTQNRLEESAAILDNTKKELQSKLFNEEEGVIKIEIVQLQKLTPIHSYLYLLFKEYGFTAWEDVLNLVTAETGKEVLSTSYRLVKNRAFLLLTKLEQNSTTEYYITKEMTSLEKPLYFKIEKVNAISTVNKNILYVDMEKINYPLVLRKRYNGDYFYPMGMQGKKKLSKYLKDEKVDAIAKEKQWLLCSNDEILWVVGRRADNRFKVSPKTKQIVKITWQN